MEQRISCIGVLENKNHIAADGVRIKVEIVGCWIIMQMGDANHDNNVDVILLRPAEIPCLSH